MGSNNGKKIERLVAALHIAETRGADVRWDDIICKRQFDVTVRFKYGLHEYLTVIECKDYARKVPAEKVDAFVTKTRDVCANKCIMISTSGFQRACFHVAKTHGITLLTLREVIKDDVTETDDVGYVINVTDFILFAENGKECYRFEDGGRFQYLCRNVKFIIGNESVTPRAVIDKIISNRPWEFRDEEVEFRCTFPQPVLAKIPYESDCMISSARFKCKKIEAIISPQPHLDNHIRQYMATHYELVDESGETYFSAPAVGLPLGCFNSITPGKFYTIPSLSMNYYCDKIEGNIVSWILVESYQHGQLLRAKMQQDVEYAWAYVEVDDERIIQRLQLLLENYLRPH